MTSSIEGITPSYQLLKQMCENGADATKVTLIFSNHGPDAVPLQAEIAALQAKYSSQLTVVHVGEVNKGMLAKLLPPASTDGLKIYVCGPSKMTEAVSGGKVFGKGPPQQGPLIGALADLGFTAEKVHKI
jgi:NAD(P)H-flavin reductase